MSTNGDEKIESSGPTALSVEQCTALLRQHQLGRLALSIDDQPRVYPMNYRFEGSTIVVRTAPGAKLEGAPLQAVAFEIDDADPNGKWGWSVIAQGPCFNVTSSLDELSEHLRDLAVEPWVPGAHEHWLKISVRRMSGSAFGILPEIDVDRSK